MASKKSYSRYFIILQEDEKGYALEREKSSSGYVKLEKKNNKCKVYFYAQNINPDMEPYYMVLVCDDKNKKKLVVTGKLSTDEQGRIDVNSEYELDNIANSKISMSHIIGASIAKVIDNNIISLMSGFTNNDVPRDWKGYEVVKVYKEERKDEEEKLTEKEKETRKNSDISEVKEELDSKEFKEYEEKVQSKVDDNKEVREDKDEIPAKNEEEVKCESREINDTIETNIRKEPMENVDEKEIELEKESVEEKEVELERENVQEKEISVKKEPVTAEVEMKEFKKCTECEINKEIEHSVDTKYDKEDDTSIKEKEYVDMFMNEIGTLDNNEEIEYCTLEDMVRKHKKHKKHMDDCCCKNNYPIGKLGNYFKGICCGFEEVDHISKEIPYSVWYKVPVKDLDDMYDNSDYHRYTVMYYPMLCYYSYICKHEHYCMGYKCNKEGKLMYIMYAIPGTKSKECQPYGGRTGFVTWVPCKNKKDYGYWIMFYDFRKSTVVIPIKKC